jgi:hypothetical protein
MLILFCFVDELVADIHMQVRFEEPSPSGRAASPARSATSASTATAVPQPASPLTTIRAARSQFSTLQSAFKFPPVLDFDRSGLAATANNAPVRAYDHALNRILEQLDAIESDGDERREVVREVERALEDVERKVWERAPHLTPVPEVTKEEVTGYDVQSGSKERQAPVSEGVVPVEVSPAVKGTKPTLPDLAPIASPADADVDLAIHEEYRSASPEKAGGSSEVAIAVPAPPQPADGGVSTFDSARADVAALAFGEPSDSTVTITPVIPAAPVPTAAPRSPNSETFLTSMSHEQFTFPPKPLSLSTTGPGEAHDDAVLVDDSSEGEGGSVKGAEDGWSEVDA